ncbi:carbohydrate esterase family 4 protein [Marasmius fiardii PR-910]|nr:carbohydrate esterase family 4 protein [Marasmius fiardii PR-910]
MERLSFRRAIPMALLLAHTFFTTPVLGQDDNGNDSNGDGGDTSSSADQDAACPTYDFPLVKNNLGLFPAVSKQASILANDTVANSKWTEISGKILGTAPKAANGKTSGYSSSDPDCWWTFAQCTTPKAAGIPADIVMVPEPGTIGFGFDDGPYCNHNAFYDFLKAANQTATMYFIGSNVIQYPKEAQRALTDGHEICIHTWSHPYLTSLKSEDVFAELYYSVKLVMGVTPTCFRPPYGDIDDRVRSIANALGLSYILWQYDSLDADVGSSGVTQASVDTAYKDFIATAQNGTFANRGTIILEHEVDNFTVTKAMEYYPQLKAVFKHIVPVGVALNKTHPYVETNYTLPTFEQC